MGLGTTGYQVQGSRVALILWLQQLLKDTFNETAPGIQCVLFSKAKHKENDPLQVLVGEILGSEDERGVPAMCDIPQFCTHSWLCQAPDFATSFMKFKASISLSS